ncbi:MAG: hypothetical protein INF44_02940 [Thalassospira sp.]|nr:hypothetical protein [Thalassospira sp.]
MDGREDFDEVHEIALGFLRAGDGRAYYEKFKDYYRLGQFSTESIDESNVVKLALGHLEDAAVDVIDLELETSIIEQVTTSVANLLQELKYQEDSGLLTGVAKSIEEVYQSFEESDIPLTRVDVQLPGLKSPERDR